MTATCVLVTGRDPEGNLSCAHSNYVRTHAWAAARAGYDVHLVCLARDARTELTPYATLHALPTRTSLVRQNLIPLHSPALTRGIAQLVDALDRREVILHGFGLWGHAVAEAHRRLSASGVRSTKLLSSYTTYLDESESQWRGLSDQDGLAAYRRFGLEQAWIRSVIGRYERHAYRSADRVLVNYQSVQRLIAARFGDDLPCQLIPYSIEQEFIGGWPARSAPPGQADPARPLIVCIARHDPRKGVDVLLHALHKVRQAGARFCARLIGDGILLEPHRRLATALQLDDCVEILGLVPNVDRYLAEADMFVLPSREEQSGSLALIEGLRTGVACIVSACDGIPEDVRHGRDVWLTTPGDAASLAEGIGSLIADPKLRRKLACAGRSAFETKFSADRFSNALDRVYRDALSDLERAA
jgi:glycosyltransferase involved in cell wall biosynthesis